MKIDRDELLRRADEALSARREVLRAIRDRGDHYEYAGGMNTVEEARDAVEHYEGYKITGQK